MATRAKPLGDKSQDLSLDILRPTDNTFFQKPNFENQIGLSIVTFQKCLTVCDYKFYKHFTDNR